VVLQEHPVDEPAAARRILSSGRQVRRPRMRPCRSGRRAARGGARRRRRPGSGRFDGTHQTAASS